MGARVGRFRDEFWAEILKFVDGIVHFVFEFLQV